MSITVEEFDLLRKHIQTKEGKEAAKKFRKRLKTDDKYCNRLCEYLSLTLDGAHPEDVAKELKLL